MKKISPLAMLFKQLFSGLPTERSTEEPEQEVKEEPKKDLFTEPKEILIKKILALGLLNCQHIANMGKEEGGESGNTLQYFGFQQGSILRSLTELLDISTEEILQMAQEKQAQINRKAESMKTEAMESDGSMHDISDPDDAEEWFTKILENAPIDPDKGH